jgi:hypothetical protein
VDVLLYLFDTDCSGNFDEGEVSFILRVLGCRLPEHKLLRLLPDLITEGKVSKQALKALVLARRLRKGSDIQVKSVGVSVTTMRLLVSWKRQRARLVAQQSVKLAKTGNIVSSGERVDQSVLATSSTAIHTLLVRCQLLASRQVMMFLKTTHGNLQFFQTKMAVRKMWTHDMRDKPKKADRDLMLYAYHLHFERRGVLLTEIPYLIQFAVTRFGLSIDKEKVASVSRLLGAIRALEDVRWLSFAEVLAIVAPLLSNFGSGAGAGDGAAGSRSVWKDVHADACVKMQSQARQQAVLICLNDPRVTAPETNYRCSVLGLHSVMAERKKVKLKWAAHYKYTYQQERRVDWEHVPREAAALLLLRRGYSKTDLLHPVLATQVAVEHPGGHLCSDLVSVTKLGLIVDRHLKKGVTAAPFSFLRRRANAVLRGLCGRQKEYIRVVKAIQLFPEAIDRRGAVFLKEVVTGSSHCYDQILV